MLFVKLSFFALGKLVTNREEVLEVWEGHYSELLNHEGNMSDLELPN